MESLDKYWLQSQSIHIKNPMAISRIHYRKDYSMYSSIRLQKLIMRIKLQIRKVNIIKVFILMVLSMSLPVGVVVGLWYLGWITDLLLLGLFIDTVLYMEFMYTVITHKFEINLNSITFHHKNKIYF